MTSRSSWAENESEPAPIDTLLITVPSVYAAPALGRDKSAKNLQPMEVTNYPGGIGKTKGTIGCSGS